MSPIKRNNWTSRNPPYIFSALKNTQIPKISHCFHAWIVTPNHLPKEKALTWKHFTCQRCSTCNNERGTQFVRVKREDCCPCFYCIIGQESLYWELWESDSFHGVMEKVVKQWIFFMRVCWVLVIIWNGIWSCILFSYNQVRLYKLFFFFLIILDSFLTSRFWNWRV